MSRRVVAVLAAVITGIAGALVVVEPALAAVSGPLAIGQATPDDINVLGVDTTTAGSPVRVQRYQVGVGTAVNKQRWTFEAIAAGGGIPAQTFRIRNVAANLCMEKPLAEGDVNGADVVIATCQSVTHQYWYIPTTFPVGGYLLRSVRDGRCLDLYVSSDGAPTTMWACGGYETQYWKVRYGGFDCNERAITALCAIPGQPMFGLFATWRQYPMTFNGPDYNYGWNILAFDTYDNNLPGNSYDYLEVGWRGQYDPDIGATAHDAYWLEQGLRGGEYIYEEHSLAAQPYGSAADGRNHSYMALADSDTGQWDILYDYNAVGKTTVASGDRLSYIETGLMVNYEEQFFLANPIENRVQWQDGNGVFRRPALGESSQSHQNTCNAPPNPMSWGRPNTPPWCFTPTLGTRADTVGTAVDYWSVGKPTSLVAKAPAAGPAGNAGPAVYNGVDQRALAACMENDADACLTTVPGLARCVAARQVCNLTASTGKSATGGRELTLDGAVAATKRMLAAGTVTARTTAAGPDRNTTNATVHVVTGTTTVKQFRGRELPHEYQGFVLTFDARTGVLLHACLGKTCA